MQLLFVLNRLQDLLGLPRTVNATYPVDTDPLHADSILIEDVWEATKILTLDQSRRGSAQISEVYHPIIKDQDVYPLPSNCCKLLDVEYINSRNPRTQLEHIYYDDMVLHQHNSYSGIPSSYCLTEASSRLVLRSSTSNSAGMIELYEQGGIPFTTTVDGTQIEGGDLIFNKTMQSEGEVKMLKSLSPILNLAGVEGGTQLTAATVNYPRSDTPYIDLEEGQIRLSHIAGELLSTNVINNIQTGMILYDEDQESWLIITKKIEEQTTSTSILLQTDGIVRGKANSIESLINASVKVSYSGGDTMGIDLVGSNIAIGTADTVSLISSDILVSDAHEGMTGGATKLVDTVTDLSGQMFLHSDGNQVVTSVDLDKYAGLISTETEDVTYVGYYLFFTDTEGDEYTGYLVSNSSISKQWTTANSSYTLAINGNKYDLYADLYQQGLATDNNPANITEIVSYTIYRETFIKGDSYQIEQRIPTLDSVTVFPVPDITDVQGAESLRFIYYAFPSKPQHIRSPIGLPEAYSDAVIAKAFEIAKRRETGGTEPYDMSLHRTTSGRRHLPETPTRKRSLQPGLYVNVPYP